MHHKFNRTARDPDAYNAGTPSVATVVRFYAVAFFGLPLAIPFFNFLYPLTHMDALQRRRHFRHFLGYAAVHAVVWTGASRDRSCRACTLETPVEPRRPVRRYTYETLRYNAPPAYLDAWARAAQRSLLSLCNNHALDQGLGGLRATRAAVGARGLVCLGGPDAETEAVALLEVGGLRLACIGLTFGINGLARGTAGLPGVPVLEFGDPRARTELDALPARMAAEVAALLPGATLAGYKEFLDTMYHYTLRSEERLRAAAGAADEPALQGFLTALAHDEARHYLLAEADLRALGSSPRADRPASVQSFEAAWSALPTAHAAAWTGALAVLEGVAAHLGAAALPALSRLGLGKAQARFVLVHLDADAAHGSLCRQHALRLGKEYSALLLQGAHAAAVAWVDMHRCLAK